MRRPSHPVVLGLGTLALVLALLGTVTIPAQSAPSSSGHPATSIATATRTAARVPTLQVTRIVRGLDIPWDVRPIGGGRLLITERTTKQLLTWRHGHLRRVAFPSSTVWASGETGLMGLVIDPQFRHNRRFYTCQGGYTAHGHDVRVMAWHLGAQARRARLIRPLLTGLPATSGRHGGCRLLIATDGSMFVGTGDAATGTNPRNLDSLGGKTLRLNRFTGAPWPSNPFLHASSRRAHYVYSFGHRNVQGLAQRADGSMWSVEQGTYRDDEVNRLVRGGDYGYNPVPGYNESVPMTDQSLPGTQIAARWRSGDPTRATSGGSWVLGPQWGAYQGDLAVATLKNSRLLMLRFTQAGRFVSMTIPAALTHYGRLRSVTQLPGGDLLVTTSNGGGQDAILRVHPVL